MQCDFKLNKLARRDTRILFAHLYLFSAINEGIIMTPIVGELRWWGGLAGPSAVSTCAGRVRGAARRLSQPCVRRDAAAVRALFGARGLFQTDYVHRRQPKGQRPELLPGVGR